MPYSEQPVGAHESPVAAQVARLDSSVLILTDDARLIAALKRGLKSLHIRATVSRFAPIGLVPRADFVLLDARCPGVLDAYLAEAPITVPPWIAVVPPGDEAQACRALEAGARALLSTPIRVEALRLAVLVVRGGKEAGEALVPPSRQEAWLQKAAQDLRLHQTATRRAQELAALMEVSVAVAAQRDPKAVCGVAMEQLVSRFGYELVSAYLREDHGLILQAQIGYKQCFDTIVEQGVIGRTLRLGVPQFVPDVRVDPDYVPAGDEVVAEVCVPILIDGHTSGVINVESCRSGALDFQTQELLILLAQQVAISVERSRLLAEERRRANLAEALARATAVISLSLDAKDIYNQVLTLLGTVVAFDTASLFRFEEGMVSRIGGHQRVGDLFSDVDVCFAAEADPIFAPWVRGEEVGPVLIAETRTEPRWADLAVKNSDYINMVRTYMAIPLVIEGEILGALSLACYRPHAFDQRTVGAALEFAERLTRALRNARLYEIERAANARLQSIMKVQDGFVATVSHELRTPLTSILGFSENLLDHWERLDDFHRRTSVAKIQRAGKRLHRLVRDLLHMSRIDAGSLRVHPAPLHLMPIICQAVEELVLEFEGQVVHVGTGMEEAEIWSDGDRLRQVIGNLLDNAAKYSPQGSPITISWSSSPPWGTITVHDHGAGIRAEDRSRLFQRFAKLDTTARAGHVGTGLGLYICRQLVESLGGTIGYDFSDDPLPEGRSSFSIRLPLTETPGLLRG